MTGNFNIIGMSPTELPTLVTTDTASINPTESSITTPETQNHMISAVKSSSSILGPAVGGAVGGLAVVIIIIAVVVITLLFVKRGQKGSLKVNNRKESVQGYNNAVYNGKQNT